MKKDRPKKKFGTANVRKSERIQAKKKTASKKVGGPWMQELLVVELDE